MIPDRDYDVVNQVPMTRFYGVGGSKLYLVHTMHEWEAFYDLLMQRRIVSCDTETSGLEYYLDKWIVGMSFGWSDLHFYAPVRHVDSLTGGVQPPQLDMAVLRPQLQKFFDQKDVFTLWHNQKFDAHFYKKDGVDINTPFHDTRILWQLFDENAPGSLKVIASGWRDELGVHHPGLVGPEAAAKEKEIDTWRANEARARRNAFSQLVMARADELQKSIAHQDKNRNQLKAWIKEHELAGHEYANARKDDVHYGFIPVDLMTEYAATDTFLTYALYEYVMRELPMTTQLKDLYINEIKLSRALFDAEESGAKIDRPYLVQLEKDLGSEIVSLNSEIKQTLGDINLGSTQQLADALIAQGVNLTQKTATGKYALDKKVLDTLQEDYPIVEKILKLREVTKVKGTYATGILSKLTSQDILHCSFNQNVTTGRMSSRDPNLMNIPGRNDSIQKAFSVPQDFVYIFGDYCLAQGTLVDTPKGHTPIEDLRVGDMVFTYNKVTKKPDCSKISAVKYTGPLPTLKVLLDNGKTVRCTGNHRWLTHLGEEVLAKDLIPGTRLLPLRRSFAGPKKYETLYSRSCHKYVYTHRAVAAAKKAVEIGRLYNIVHHVDEDHLNNDPDNLELLDNRAEHNKLHGANCAKQWQDPIVRERMRMGISRSVKEGGGFHGKKNPNYGNFKGKEKQCPACNGTFYKPPSTRAVYCSKDCYIAARRGESDLNCKVISVENDGLCVPTYDLEVARDHNFALSAGVFVHNSQVEVRLTAHYSKDPLLLDAYKKGQDIHTRTLCEMFGFDYDVVQPILAAEDPNCPNFQTYKSLRQVAKCVHPSTIIRTPSGPQRIGSLPFSTAESTFLPTTKTTVQGSSGWVDCSATYSGNTQPLLHVVTNRGIVTCTNNHRFVSDEGSLRFADDLVPGDGVVCEPAKLHFRDSIPVLTHKPFGDVPALHFSPTRQLAYVAGLFAGDGSVSGSHSVSITHGPIAAAEYSLWQQTILSACSEAGLRPVPRNKSVYLGSRSVLRFFESLELVDTSRQYDPRSQKSWFIPSWVWGNTSFLCSYLAGVFDTDGSVSKGGILSVTTKSPWLAGDLCEALHTLGLRFTLELSYNKTYNKDYYRIRLGLHEGGFFFPYLRYTKKRDRLRPYTPGLWKSRVRDLVLKVANAGVHKCVDLEVSSSDHLYVTNGIVTHNTINFGIIYGVSAPGLSDQIPRPAHYKGISKQEWIGVCQDYIDQYLDKYRGVQRFINSSGRDIKKHGVVYNWFGRPRRLPHAQVKDRSKYWMVGRAQRQGTNFLVQGSCADIFKIAVVRVHELLQDKKSYMVNFVHDEIQVYLHKSEFYLLNDLKRVMEDFHFIVPLVVDFAWSTTNWAAKRKLG